MEYDAVYGIRLWHIFEIPSISKYANMGIQFDNKNNYHKLIHDVGKAK